jgi:hypothetical protein
MSVKPMGSATLRSLRRGLSVCAVVAIALAALVAPAALALTEEQQGARIVNAIHAGTLSGRHLSTTQYERVGEYVMGREIGSPRVHERMNAMMEKMMGQAATDQVHVYLGRRYLGVSTAATSASMMNQDGVAAGGMMGSGMMGYGLPAHHAAISAAAVAGVVVGALAVVGIVVALLLRRDAR